MSAQPTSRTRALIASAGLLVCGIGAGAHFLFDAIGRWPPLGWIAPTNESLWEHIKMAFWPTLVVDWIVGRKLPTLRHRVVGTAISATVSTLLIAPLFYGYVDILGHHFLVADIAIFAIAVCAGHWLEYRVAIGPAPTAGSVWAAVALVTTLAVALVVFTYAPPHMEVFRDASTGRYGLE